MIHLWSDIIFLNSNNDVACVSHKILLNDMNSEDKWISYKENILTLLKQQIFSSDCKVKSSLCFISVWAVICRYGIKDWCVCVMSCV